MAILIGKTATFVQILCLYCGRDNQNEDEKYYSGSLDCIADDGLRMYAG